MIAFFMNAEVALGTKLLEIVYIIMGLTAIYAGIRNAMDEENPSRLGSGIFWCILGVLICAGRWIPDIACGVLILIMVIPAIFKRVKTGKNEVPTQEDTKVQFEKIGMKIFVPALAIGIGGILFALLTNLGALVGVGAGVIVAIVVLMILDSRNKPAIFLNDSKRLLDAVGPLSMLPMLLASLGAIFTAAGVGDVIATLVKPIIPEGNLPIAIIIFAVGMAIFTIIMGNAFAAITVMITGIGAPFILAHGADPVIIGMIALTCGYCGTLMTPMAANFNIVPVAMLDMKDNYGVIKNQVMIALIMLAVQIVYMIALS